jgi:Fe-S-cluster containining protein
MLEPNLTTIKRMAQIREDENMRFRYFLKGIDNQGKVDKIVHRLHEEITTQIDCKECGNCCKVLIPEIHPDDVKQLAELENLSVEEYEKHYCEKDTFGDLSFKTAPCRYLDGKICSIYNLRPQECSSYPNTHKKDFASRSLGMIGNYEVCPIVFNLMEKLKDELGFAVDKI